MVTTNNDPEAGGNVAQPDDGRDELGRLPEPLDAAHWPPTDDGPAILIPGMPASQPAGLGPVVSTPVDIDATEGVEHRDDSAAAQGGPDVGHDVSGSPIVDGAAAAPSAPSGPGLRSDTHGTMTATPPPAKKTTPAASKAKAADTPPPADGK